VDHVGVVDGVGVLEGPNLSRHVEEERGQEVRQRGVCAAGDEVLSMLFAVVARLEGEVR
jgi:hypothetical protein